MTHWRRSDVFIVNFEHSSHHALVFHNLFFQFLVTMAKVGLGVATEQLQRKKKKTVKIKCATTVINFCSFGRWATAFLIPSLTLVEFSALSSNNYKPN